MSVLKMMFGKHAPTHHAEAYWPCHDKTLNVVEARRGRGKSYGAVKIAVEWLKERMGDIRAGRAPHARVYTNIRFDRRRLALVLCLYGICKSHEEALAVFNERIVYCESWDELLVAYDSLILMDEANRNLNIYDSQKASQSLMLTVHDWLQQTRKHKLTMYYLVQDLAWLKPQVLALCDRLWRAKRVRIKGTQNVKAFPWYGGDPFSKGKDQGVSRGVDFKMRFPFDVRLARCYDTLQAVRTWGLETRFHSFGELADYMLLHDLKPKPAPTIADALTHEDEKIFWASCPAPPSALPPSGGGAEGGSGAGLVERCLLDVFNPSTLPVSFPGDRV